MIGLNLDNLVEAIFSPRTLWAVLWGGLILLTGALLVLSRTRWGQARPLSKCVVLSIFAHGLLVGYAYRTNLFFDYPAVQAEGAIKVTLITVDREQETQHQPARSSRHWDRFADQAVVRPRRDDLPRSEPAEAPTPKRRVDQPPDALPSGVPTPSLATDEVVRPVPDRTKVESFAADSPAGTAAVIEVPQPRRRDSASPVQPTPQSLEREATVDRVDPTPPSRDSGGLPAGLLDVTARVQRLADLPTTSEPLSAAASRQDQPLRSTASVPNGFPVRRPQRPSAAQTMTTPGEARETVHSGSDMETGPSAAAQPRGDSEQPSIYHNRVTTDRKSRAERYGGNARTEAAVRAALKWLAANQSSDGRWNASTLGGGLETNVAGHDRAGAGAQADTGVTGLALLAFLAAGHTHLEGTYREHVQRGLEYLLSVQRPSGNLGGPARMFATMYCHGMATFAVSEAYAMTGDERLRLPVEQAVAYTVAAQHPSSGGWRYQPGDLGDLSQFGWQVMALKSAELAGVEIPQQTQAGMNRFLRSVSSGRHGGLASYRPGHQPSRTMTAEALVCRQFLGDDRNGRAATEAAQHLMEQLPDDGRVNLYYWYYATLALFQLQDERWPRWNNALKRRLLQSQRSAGELAGSWDSNTVWGNYGGRAYTTALATLCLETYYRFLPLYGDPQSTANRRRTGKSALKRR